MADTPARYPTRKRARISYHEEPESDKESKSDVETSEDGWFDSDYECVVTKKSKKAVSKKDDKPLAKKDIFPFLSLPAELRNTIYELLLELPESEKGIYLRQSTTYYRRFVQRRDPPEPRFVITYHDGRRIPPIPPPLFPAILAVNQQICKEGYGVLYSRNKFIIPEPQVLHSFISGLTQRARDALRVIELKQWHDTRDLRAYNHTSLSMLSFCPNLQKLVIYINENVDAGGGARQLYRDGVHWMEEVGRAKGRIDAAVDIIEMGEEVMWYMEDKGGRVVRGSSGEPVYVTPGKWMEVFRGELRRILMRNAKPLLKGK